MDTYFKLKKEKVKTLRFFKLFWAVSLVKNILNTLYIYQGFFNATSYKLLLGKQKSFK